MLSIHKINAGSGYEYLVRSVARSDADYYLQATETGDPPGVWAGRATETLGVSGTATEEQIRNLYGLGVHPDRGDEPLGAPFAPPSLALDRIRRWEAEHPDAPPEERAAVVALERIRGNRNSVAALDLTFSPPKSWSVLWAAVRPGERAQMWAAHHAGVSAALRYLETHAAFTRLGHDGVRQVETGGLTAVRFDHSTSRAGDVQPHSHLLVSSKVQGPDGRWRSLDSTQVYAVLAAAGALYSTVRDTETARALGTEHELRPDLKEREVVGVPERLRREYSGRRARIEAELTVLVQAWEDRHGASPPPAVRARMSEYLALRTRPDKRRGESAEQMLDRMERRARSVGFALDEVRAAALGRRTDDARTRAGTPPPPADLVLAGLSAVTTERTVWTRWHLQRAIENRQSIDTSLTAEDIAHRAEALTDAGLAHPDVRRISAPELMHIPVELRRRIDDASVFVRHGSTVYTTQDLLDAERRLLEAGRRPGGVTVPPSVLDRVLAAHAAAGAPLDPAQSAAVRRFVTEDRALDVLEGPAGSGKSRAMRAVVDAWTAAGRDVLGLALSQQAAQVLAEESGARTENIAKFLFHHQHRDGAGPSPSGRRSRPRSRLGAARTGRRSSVPAAAGRPETGSASPWTLRPGQLVLVDEAAMADTRRMAQIVAIAEQAGAVVRAVGDDAQITSPEAGGWFSLVADDVAAPRLNQLHRFAAPWEAQASLQLRAGDPAVLATYAQHGRLIAGDLSTLRAAAYAAWADDERAGRTSLLLVGTNARAAEMSAQARDDLVLLGRVEAEGVELHDGTIAGRGDRVVTRLNDSTTRDADGRQVANRDHWIVRRRHRDGRLTVERLDHGTGRPPGRTVTLSASYVAADVELAYAAVVAGKQGATVDTTHSLIDEHIDLPSLYVTATRGRHRNTLYVETVRAHGEDQGVADTPEAVLARIMAAGRAGRPLSAHQALRDAQTGATSLAVLGPIWDDVITVGNQRQVADILARIDPAVADAARADPAWPTLLATARDAHDRGWPLDALLNAAVTERHLDGVEGVARVLTWRLRRITGPLDDRPDGGLSPDTGTAGRRADAPPEQGTGPAEDPATAWPSYVARTPRAPDDPSPSPELVVARQAAELLDARVAALRDDLAHDPPEWASRAFGPVPEDPLDRDRWTARAGAVAAYRERYGLDARAVSAESPGATGPAQAGPTGPVPDDATAEDRAAAQGRRTAGGPPHELGHPLLGPRPRRDRVEALQLWEHAHRALGDASELTRLRGAQDQELRAAADAAERHRAEKPLYVGEDLRDAALRLRGAHAAEAELRGHLDRTAAQLAQLTGRARISGATRSALKQRLDQLHDELDRRAPRTAEARQRYEAAAALHERWRRWDSSTMAERRTGSLAVEVLDARRPRSTGPARTLADRLAAERNATAHAATKTSEAVARRRAAQERSWREQQDRVLRQDPGRSPRGPGPSR